MALKAQAPIVPVAINGARDAMRKGSPWIQPVTIRVSFGQPIPTAGLGMDDREDAGRHRQNRSGTSIERLKGRTVT